MNQGGGSRANHWIDNEVDILKDKQVVNYFSNPKVQTYHNFSVNMIELNTPLTTGGDQCYIFNIDKYGDLVSKMYLKFKLPKLIKHPSSKWASWVNLIGFYIVDHIDVIVNDQIKESISGYSLHTQWLTSISSGHKYMSEKIIGMYHTDVELRKNALTESSYVIPLHMFFTKAYHNAFPLINNDMLQLKVYFTSPNKRYISSNMIPPINTYNISPTLDVEYVFLSKDESSQIQTKQLTYIIQVNNDVHIPVLNLNNNHLSYIKNELINNIHSIQDFLTEPEYYNVYDDAINYYENMQMNFNSYNSFHFEFFASTIPYQNGVSEINAYVDNSYIEPLSIVYNTFSYLFNSNNNKMHFSSIGLFVNCVHNIVSSSFFNSLKTNGFDTFINNSHDTSDDKYMKYIYNSFAKSDLEDDTPQLDSIINSLYDIVEVNIDEFEQHIQRLDSEKKNIESYWLGNTLDNDVDGTSLFDIDASKSRYENKNVDLTAIKESYIALKGDIQNEQLPPLTQYINTYMNDLKQYLHSEIDSYKTKGYFESYLNIFSYNNTLFMDSEIIQYSPGNYHINSFQFYINNVNSNNTFSPLVNDYPPSGPPPDYTQFKSINKYRTSLERVLDTNTFVFNSTPFQYFISNTESLVETMIDIVEYIEKDNTLNIGDMTNAVNIIDGLNLIISNRKLDTNISRTEDMIELESSIHENITTVLHDCISSQQTVFFDKAINPIIKHNLDTIDYTTRYLYTLINHNSLTSNCLFDTNSCYYNDTIFTLLQYKRDYGSQSPDLLLQNVHSFIPIIEVFEDVYETFHIVCSHLSEIKKYTTDIYSVTRNLLNNTKNDEAVHFIIKSEFNSITDETSFNSSYEYISTCRTYVEMTLNKLWLKQFNKIKENYNANVAQKHVDRYLENIRGKQYKLKTYIESILNLNVLDIYTSLLEYDINNNAQPMYNNNYILYTIMNKIYLRRTNIIFLDTLGYNIKLFTNDFTKNVSYPIQIDNMPISNIVYHSMLSDIDNTLTINTHQIDLNVSAIESIHVLNAQIDSVFNSIDACIIDIQYIDSIEDNIDIYKSVFEYNSLSTNSRDINNTYVSFLYNSYLKDVESYELNKIINENNSILYAKINDFVIPRLKSDIMKPRVVSMDWNFDLFKRLPIKCIWFSLHIKDAVMGRNRHSMITHEYIELKQIKITIETSTTIISRDALTFMKPYFYSEYTGVKSLYCLPFCISTDSIQPSGSFANLPQNTSIRIELDIITSDSYNIFAKVHATQFEQLVLNKI